ncbi:hypothetical protein CBR_g5630 [Chara braunii]|uniref:NADH dehydrogenase [ubiquinone] 1 alpha subcomplex subunit 1 n=1 Tax=Chara braunii TaxID=69332 RepID=A0A388JRM6_CHABU|nr:hypothetical protein CBR_g5630 [Chara braunii]|eukprot:GBG60456.1 hypothetical protein CBR_g5630 [Chara braunii]
MALEALPPFIIIGGALVLMGGIQHTVHKALYGKPKHPRSDAWDYAMEERDSRILEEAAAAAAAGGGAAAGGKN